MILRRYDSARLLCRLCQRVHINGLYRPQVDDPGGDALLLQLFRRDEALLHHHADTDQCHVRAVPQRLRLAQLQLHGVGIRMHIAADTASQPHIHRAGGTDGLKHRRLHLAGIRRHDHPHIGQRPHDGDIFDGLVGSAVLTYADTAMGGYDLHIHLGIADGVPDLLKGLLRGKHAIGRPDDRMPKGGNARRDAHRIGLRDAHGIEPLRPPLLKLDASGGF